MHSEGKANRKDYSLTIRSSGTFQTWLSRPRRMRRASGDVRKRPEITLPFPSMTTSRSQTLFKRIFRSPRICMESAWLLEITFPETVFLSPWRKKETVGKIRVSCALLFSAFGGKYQNMPASSMRLSRKTHAQKAKSEQYAPYPPVRS